MTRMKLCIACGGRGRGSWGGLILCQRCGEAAGELHAIGAGSARRAALLIVTDDQLQWLDWLGVADGIREEVLAARTETGLTDEDALVLSGLAAVGAEMTRFLRAQRERLDALKENARRENAVRAAALAEKGETEAQRAARETRRRELNAALGR